MHLEVRKRGKKQLYYLAHSFRDNGDVRKIRRYLGADLKKDVLEGLKKEAERSILEQVESNRKIRDPLHTVLSPAEKETIKKLIAKGDIKVKHLSKEGWQRFTELFAYNTNAIEGSTVTAAEARYIIESGKWPGERSKEEISETLGVAEAVEFIRKTREHISLDLIRSLHRIVFRNSKPFAGELREAGVEVAVVDGGGNVIHRGAPQRQVIPLLRELVGWYGKNKGSYHPIVLAAVVHNQFENVHPFQDGNGRVGRLLLNNILLRHGLPPVSIELKNRKEYYSTLQAYENMGNLRPTIELILKEYRELGKPSGVV
jgi:Fic family protein